MSFTITRLAGGTAMIAGVDIEGATGKTVVSTVQSDELAARSQHKAAEHLFGAKVEEFFAPLNDALEELTKTLEGKAADPLEFVVITEGVEGVEAVEPTIVRLSLDSQILKLIESGSTDRLRWLDEKTLVITEYVAPVAVDVAEVFEGLFSDQD